VERLSGGPLLILLTNDDGIYAPGLIALERQLEQLGEVYVVAPATEQSGVGHSITYLSPLVVKELFDARQRRGWAVEGSPADCVKLGICEYLPRRPDLVVSGINSGLNAGINVLYSGTVAAAIEGAFFDVTSIAVSLEWDEQANFDRAAEIARTVVEQIGCQSVKGPRLYNLNIPTAATGHDHPQLHVVPMGLRRGNDSYEKRIDPRGRNYYWAVGDWGSFDPAADEPETDLTALKAGRVTLTPLDFDLTEQKALAEMKNWKWDLGS
jgi:5'-nucleotidase